METGDGGSDVDEDKEDGGDGDASDVKKMGIEHKEKRERSRVG